MDNNQRLLELCAQQRVEVRKTMRAAIIYPLVAAVVFLGATSVFSRHYASHEVGLMAQAHDLSVKIDQVRENIFGRELFYYHPADTMLTQTEFIERATARRDSLVQEMYNPKGFFNEEFLAECGIN